MTQNTINMFLIHNYNHKYANFEKKSLLLNMTVILEISIQVFFLVSSPRSFFIATRYSESNHPQCAWGTTLTREVGSATCLWIPGRNPAALARSSNIVWLPESGSWQESPPQAKWTHPGDHCQWIKPKPVSPYAGSDSTGEAIFLHKPMSH